MFRNVKKELIAIPAQMSYLSQVRDFIEHIGRKYKYSDKVANSFKLVIEEACTNIIRHGYRDIKGGEITLKAIIRRQSLTIVIIDQGISFDPRQAATPDLQKYIQIGKKGGLGIFMMRKLMDDVQYSITSRGNELRLTKQREIVTMSKPMAWWESLTMRTRHTIQASAALTAVALIVSAILNSNVSESTLNDVIESTRSQALTLAENSSEPIQLGRELELFEFTKSTKNSNPETIYEVFIVDTAQKILSASTTIKALGKYKMPVDPAIISQDTLRKFSINYYTAEDSLAIFDFQVPIYANPLLPGSVVGWVHVWVPEDYVEARMNSTRLRILIYLAGILSLVFVGMYFLVDRIVAPFHSLADWVRDVGQGTVDEDEIDIDASDELGEIAQAFNMMTNKFREAQVGLIEQQRLQKELQVAQEIQQMLLPSDFPQVQGYELASFYEAAKEVGGDLFDFVEVDQDTIGICVADVAGKGVPGSLIMTMIRTALRLEARGNKNPADVLAKVNRFVTDDMKRGMFVTMFYLVLDSRNRIIHYASAGHNPMILYRGSTKQTYYLNPSGFPVGIQLPDISLFDQRIESDSIRLREDDMLVLYTDGVTEAMNTKRDLYREERFLEAVRNNSHFEVSEFIKAVRDDIKQFTQNYPQNDDITYVAIKEKLMQGEVIYQIQKELFRMIEEEGVSVKDACDKMQVSPYMYRKYKKIKDSVGLDGLKDLLYNEDYIEKKHISIEDKTKMFDIISKNPDFGAKRISDALNTEEYGYTKIASQRVYNELKKAKLNTQERRENHIKRGGKKRLKAPGTPLMTLDGQVILDYQSAEEVVAKKRGTSVEETRPFTPVQTQEESKKATIFTSKPKAEAKPAEAVPEKSEDKPVEEPVKSETNKTPVPEEQKPQEVPAQEPEPEATPEPVETVEAAEPDEEATESTPIEEPAVAAEPAVAPQPEDQPEEHDSDADITAELTELTTDETAEAEPEETTELQTEQNVTSELTALPTDETEESKPEADQPSESPVEETLAVESEGGAAEESEEEPVSLDEYLKLQREQETTAPAADDILSEPEADTLHIDLEDNKADKELIVGSNDEITLDRTTLAATDEVPDSLAMPDQELDKDTVGIFYKTVNDDIQIIKQVVGSWTNGDISEKDLSKIKLSLRIMITHPLLKKMPNLRQLFIQIQKGITFLEENLTEISATQASQNAKEMLKYIEKENILKNKDVLLEQINEIGLQQHSLRSRLIKKSRNNHSQVDTVREKILQKKLIKDSSVLGSVSKNNRG